MLGMVFTELVEMVEDKFSPELADEVLAEANFDHGGAYTSVGYYDFEEIVTLVTLLSKKTDIAVPDLLEAFGYHLFGRFTVTHASLIGESSLFEFLSKVDNHIHVEVIKLYPNAKLPKFNTVEHSDQRLVLRYESERQLHHLALGLMRGAADHFTTPVNIDMTENDDQTVIFTLEKH